MDCCWMAVMHAEGLKKFSCHEVLALHYKWKAEFRKKNRTDEIIKNGGKDAAYIEYASAIDTFLNSCPHNKVSMSCQFCSPQQHEGHFCRCESRNINLSKQIRHEQCLKEAENSSASPTLRADV